MLVGWWGPLFWLVWWKNTSGNSEWPLILFLATNFRGKVFADVYRVYIFASPQVFRLRLYIYIHNYICMLCIPNPNFMGCLEQLAGLEHRHGDVVCWDHRPGAPGVVDSSGSVPEMPGEDLTFAMIQKENRPETAACFRWTIAQILCLCDLQNERVKSKRGNQIVSICVFHEV